jgi:hypothetical protein
MSTFVFRLKGPRPAFALDMTDKEREIMGRHAAYWQPMIDSGGMVIFGPLLPISCLSAGSRKPYTRLELVPPATRRTICGRTPPVHIYAATE